MTSFFNAPLILRKTRVDKDGGKVLGLEELGEVLGAGGALDKDDDLVELEAVEHLEEAAELLLLRQRDVVLLQTVEGQLGLVIDEDLEGLTQNVSL